MPGARMAGLVNHLYALCLAVLLLASGCAANNNTASPLPAANAPDAAENQMSVYQDPVSPALTRPSEVNAGVNAATASRARGSESHLEPNEYRIGSHDLMQISVFGVPELSGDVRVNGRGFISMPLIGVIDAKDLTSSELAARIEGKLAEDYLQDPHVTIFIKEYASQRFTIDGAVDTPGIYAMTGKTTLLQGIALAGGLASLANPKDVRLFRLAEDGERKMATLDLDKIRSGEHADEVLQGNDVVVVMRSGARVLLNDSLLRDTINLLNPFSYLKP